MLGHVLDKNTRFTDWSRRPLDEAPVVTPSPTSHLIPCADGRQAPQVGRGGWLDEEMERLADPVELRRPTAGFCLETSRSYPSAIPQCSAAEGDRRMARDREARGKNLPANGSSGRHFGNSPPIRPRQDDLGKITVCRAGAPLDIRLKLGRAHVKPMTPNYL
jgi:hypothetical protein